MPAPYLQVFTDGIISSLVIPVHSQTTFFAMKAFGSFDVQQMQLSATVATLGATFGHLLNYGFGQLALKGLLSLKPNLTGNGFSKVANFFNSYGLFVLLLSPYGISGIFSVAAGAFRTRLRYALPLLLIGQAGFYIYSLMQ